MKIAMVAGVLGQDGAYLSKFLLDKGYKVVGLYRRVSNLDLYRHQFLGIQGKITLESYDAVENEQLVRLIKKYKPDEFYNLTAMSFVKESFEIPIFTSQINGIGVLRALEALRTYSPETKFYQASTSEMFGKVQEVPQTEVTPFYPRSPYGIAKLFGHWMTINYREAYGMHACSGICFNHESPLRGVEFVTQKIVKGLVGIIHKKDGILELGNLEAKRDWGFAGDYVEAMWLSLQAEVADDFVYATGKTSSIKQWIQWCLNELDQEIEWEGEQQHEIGRLKKNGEIIITINPEFYRPTEVDILLGNPSKAKKELGWEAKIVGQELASIMIQAELERIN